MRFAKDKYLYITFFLCALISGIVFGYYMIVSDGVFTLFDDFNLQQIPFACVVNETIKQGSQWSWSTDLGTSLIAGYSFYNLGSPFYWITLLFSSKAYPYLMGWLFILKYAVAGTAAYAYTTYFLNDRRWGVLAGILYAFSGFQSFNIMFFHFHDVVALFPLVLIGLEEYIRNNKKAVFIFSIFINAITNYFFFVGEVVFVALYFVVREVDLSNKEAFVRFVKKGMMCVSYAVVGVAMAGVIFVPSVLFILGNSRASAGMPGLFYDRNQLLNLFRAFIWPVDIQNDHATINSGEWNSISLYLPLWGISLVLAYVVKKIKEKDRLAILVIVLVVMSFVPILNALFYGLTEATYKRWWYMLVLILSLLTAKVLEEREYYRFKFAIIINILWAAAFIVVVFALKLILKQDLFLVNVILIIVGVLCAFLLVSIKSNYRLVIILTSVFACFTTFYTVHLYRGDNNSADYMRVYNAGAELDEIDPQYRYNTNYNMFALVGNVGNMGTFSSTVSNSIAEFHGNLGEYRENLSPYTSEHEYIRMLFGGKYDIIGTAEGFEVVESDDVSPIGYAVDSYVIEDELREYASANGYDEGVKLLLADVAIKDDVVQKYGLDSVLVHDSDLNNVLHSDALDFVKTNQDNKADDFVRTKKGFECTTSNDVSKAIYFTVPFDKGWRAKINGEKIDIISSNGMMLVIVPAGDSIIEFTYRTPGVISGMILSVVGIIFWLMILLNEKHNTYYVEG